MRRVLLVLPPRIKCAGKALSNVTSRAFREILLVPVRHHLQTRYMPLPNILVDVAVLEPLPANLPQWSYSCTVPLLEELIDVGQRSVTVVMNPLSVEKTIIPMRPRMMSVTHNPMKKAVDLSITKN